MLGYGPTDYQKREGEKMAVITISRQFSEHSEEIIKKVAELCKIPIVDKSNLADLLSQYGLIDFESFYDSEHNFIDRFDSENEAYIELMNKAVLAFAKRNHLIILGRGGFSLLKEYSNVLNVLLKAPVEQRAADLIGKAGVEEGESALMIIEQKDTVRKKFLQTYYGIKSLEAEDFDLVLDMAKISPDVVASLISQAYADLCARDVDPTKATDTIEVDKVMFEAVKSFDLG